MVDLGKTTHSILCNDKSVRFILTFVHSAQSTKNITRKRCWEFYLIMSLDLVGWVGCAQCTISKGELDTIGGLQGAIQIWAPHSDTSKNINRYFLSSGLNDLVVSLRVPKECNIFRSYLSLIKRIFRIWWEVEWSFLVKGLMEMS